MLATIDPKQLATVLGGADVSPARNRRGAEDWPRRAGHVQCRCVLSPELQATIQRAVDDVRGRRHEYLTLEHLLLAILDDPSGADIVGKCGGDVEKLRGDLERFLDEQV